MKHKNIEIKETQKHIKIKLTPITVRLKKHKNNMRWMKQKYLKGEIKKNNIIEIIRNTILLR